jgi:hypothetical protein
MSKINGCMDLMELIEILNKICVRVTIAGLHDKEYKKLNETLISKLDIEVADLELNVYNLRKHPDENPWEAIAEAEATGN